MLLDDGIDLRRNPSGNLAHASGLEIEAGHDAFKEGGNLISGLVVKNVQHVHAFVRSLKEATIDTHLIADVDLCQVVNVCLECDASDLFRFNIVGCQTEMCHQSSHCFAKEMGVPGDIHVPHFVPKLLRDGHGIGLGKLTQLDFGKGRSHVILELRGLGDSDELLPDIVTAEEAEEGLRHLVEAVNEAFTILKCSGLHPLAELRKRFAVAVCKVEH